MVREVLFKRRRESEEANIRTFTTNSSLKAVPHWKMSVAELKRGN